MSKLSFRARALDASKPIPVYCSEDIPDLPDFAAINRAVPQMPTGMEKEEECEHHLQRAISAQQAYGKTGDLVIPTPEVFCCEQAYQSMYPPDFKLSRQLIHMQPFAMEQDIPDYDMDSEDERWVNQQAKKMEISSMQFEEMMDRLEKGSGQQVVTLKEAKILLKEDDDLIIAVYDYWLNKRLRTQNPLIPQVKNEKRDGSTNNNPYVAFRRRTEKMQTRKNRKNDEASYEKMLKLRRDLSRALTALEMVKRREKTKREDLHLCIEVFEKRYQASDFTGQLLQEVTAMRPARPAFIPVHQNQFSLPRQDSWSNKTTKEAPRKKREYKRRKHKQQNGHVQMPPNILQQYSDMDVLYQAPMSSEDERFSAGLSDQEDENDPDGQFSFKRKKCCQYQSPLESFGNWPWCNTEDGGVRISNSDKKYRYCMTTLHKPKTSCIGLARRRMGRGGRIILDRIYAPLDDHWSEVYGTSTFFNSEVQFNSNEKEDGLVNTCNCFVLKKLLSQNLQFNLIFMKDVLNFLFQLFFSSPHFWPKQMSTSLKDANIECNERTSDLVSNNQTFSKSNESVMINQNVLTCGLDNLVTGEDSGIVPIELTIESFQSHQEELIKMQKKQQEKVSVHCDSARDRVMVSDHSSLQCPSTSSSLLLDSASAEFAVTALVNTKQVSTMLNSISSVPGTTSSVTTTSSLISSSKTSFSSLSNKKPFLNGPSSHTSKFVTYLHLIF
ncbi:Enhancer of polycomb 1 [Nymphon striatum]|nr:Enhancer of polycomb 1 [Nymphon striatum]